MNSTPSDPTRTPTALSSSAFLTMWMWLAILTSIAVLGVLALYVQSNDSNHTGFEPWLLALIFAPTLVLGLFALRRGKSICTAILATTLGIGGIGYLTYLDSTNRLIEYERWIDRGMPTR